MRGALYILDGRIPMEVALEGDWADWMRRNERHVAVTQLNDGVYVSTVFLGVDHSVFGNRPILFETLVFGGQLDGEMDRYFTWEEAEAGHAAMVERVRNADPSQEHHES